MCIVSFRRLGRTTRRLFQTTRVLRISADGVSSRGQSHTGWTTLSATRNSLCNLYQNPIWPQPSKTDARPQPPKWHWRRDIQSDTPRIIELHNFYIILVLNLNRQLEISHLLVDHSAQPYFYSFVGSTMAILPVSFWMPTQLYPSHPTIQYYHPQWCEWWRCVVWWLGYIYLGPQIDMLVWISNLRVGGRITFTYRRFHVHLSISNWSV